MRGARGRGLIHDFCTQRGRRGGRACPLQKRAVAVGGIQTSVSVHPWKSS